MDRLAFAIFFMAFVTITGAIIVAFLTLNMSEPVHFYGAAGVGAVLSVILSIILSRKLKA